MSFTIAWRRLNKVIEGFEDVKDSDFKIRELFLEIWYSWIDLLVEPLGIGVDPRDTPSFMVSE